MKQTMQKAILSALVVACVSGLAIGAQASLNSAAGKVTGAALTGLLVNFFGGLAAGLLLVVLYYRQGGAEFSAIQSSTLKIIIVSGLLGIGIIAGISFSLPKIGIAVGLSTIIAAQMLVAVAVDTFGLTGGQPVPLSWTRIGGLALLMLGTWIILPKE